MIYNDVELHNVADTSPWADGVMMHRFPAEVRKHLSPRGRFIAEEVANSEIRFVTDAVICHVYLSIIRGSGEVLVYRGDQVYRQLMLTPGQTDCIELGAPDGLKQVKPEALDDAKFAPQLWRIVPARGMAALLKVDAHGASLRPPKPKEKPPRTWLAYGSSITNGGAATRTQTTYVAQAARRLGVDVLNLGLSGACICEKELADYLAGREDWDFATLEIGVNMRGAFTPEEFRPRVDYMVGQFLEKNPGKPIAILTAFTNAMHCFAEECETRTRQMAFDDHLRETVAKDKSGQLHLIEGREILKDFTGLSCDLIHPSDFGHIQMGENLARALGAII